MKRTAGRNVYYYEVETEEDGFLGVFWDKTKAEVTALRCIGATGTMDAPEVEHDGPRMMLSFQGKSAVVTTHPRYTRARAIPVDGLLERMKFWH